MKIVYFPRFQYEESMSLFKMSGSASISTFKKYIKYINITHFCIIRDEGGAWPVVGRSPTGNF